MSHAILACHPDEVEHDLEVDGERWLVIPFDNAAGRGLLFVTLTPEKTAVIGSVVWRQGISKEEALAEIRLARGS